MRAGGEAERSSRITLPHNSLCGLPHSDTAPVQAPNVPLKTVECLRDLPTMMRCASPLRSHLHLRPSLDTAL